MTFFKDELHEKQTNMLLKKFGLNDLYSDVEYGSFSYLISATYKAEHILPYIDDYNNIDVEGLLEKINVFSSSEKDMIKFALQCFNNTLSDISLADVMWSLDETNNKIVKQAIQMRY